MSKFLRTLAKVGLVELDGAEAQRVESQGPPVEVDEEELRRILAEDEASAAAEQPPPVPASSPAPPGSGESVPSAAIEEGRSFESVYATADVPPSPYQAEKLLRVLDGLRAMDPATRKAAVLAMDAADEDWTVHDAVVDAQRKMRALERTIQSLSQAGVVAEQHSQAELKSQDAYQEKATQEIRKQIADLEKLLQDELQAVAEKKAEVHAQLRATREACARETTRFRTEITRLGELTTTFAPPPTPGKE